MDKVTPNCYIQFKRKICNPTMITTINRLAGEWAMSAQDVIYKMINERVTKENNKHENERR
jgi:hypothetical protein